VDENDDRAKLIEIDENLARGELSAAERANHIGTRKEIYERLHPETRHGAAPGKSGGGKKAAKEPNSGSFAKDTATKTGRSKSSILADATRADHIPDIDRVVGTSLDQGEELDALAKLTLPHTRRPSALLEQRSTTPRRMTAWRGHGAAACGLTRDAVIYPRGAY
jgi:hypothetical protein